MLNISVSAGLKNFRTIILTLTIVCGSLGTLANKHLMGDKGCYCMLGALAFFAASCPTEELVIAF